MYSIPSPVSLYVEIIIELLSMRNKTEIESYCERLKTNQVINDAEPLQQRLPEVDTNILDVDMKFDEAEAYSLQTREKSSL
ncbi:hypothetical protein RYX36_033032, partial [Vicia faba]